MFEGQPKGLYALALANTGERFGYYTMLAIFTLFLQAKFGYTAAETSTIFGCFLAAVYFIPFFGKDKGVQFFVNLGPQIGLLLNESEKRKGTWETANRAPNEQYGKWVENKFDYGIVGGGGIEVRTKAGNFLLEGRYYFGLADFYNSTKKDYFSRSANSTITAKITYLFDIKK